MKQGGALLQIHSSDRRCSFLILSARRLFLPRLEPPPLALVGWLVSQWDVAVVLARPPVCPEPLNRLL